MEQQRILRKRIMDQLVSGVKYMLGTTTVLRSFSINFCFLSLTVVESCPNELRTIHDKKKALIGLVIRGQKYSCGLIFITNKIYLLVGIYMLVPKDIFAPHKLY